MPRKQCFDLLGARPCPEWEVGWLGGLRLAIGSSKSCRGVLLGPLWRFWGWRDIRCSSVHSESPSRSFRSCALSQLGQPVPWYFLTAFQQLTPHDSIQSSLGIFLWQGEEMRHTEPPRPVGLPLCNSRRGEGGRTHPRTERTSRPGWGEPPVFAVVLAKICSI